MRRNVLGFSAAVIGEEHKSALVKGFEEHCAATGALAIKGAEHHGGGLLQISFDGLLKPATELLDWIGI